MHKTIPFLLLAVVSHPSPERLSVFPGWPVQLDAPISKVADPEIASARGNQLTGLKDGRTRVEAGGKTYDVVVESAGWSLQPVLVAVHDKVEETPWTADDLTVRLVPKAMVTTSLVTPPNGKYLLNQKALVPVQAGDLLLWSMFERKR